MIKAKLIQSNSIISPTLKADGMPNVGEIIELERYGNVKVVGLYYENNRNHIAIKYGTIFIAYLEIQRI